MGPVLSVVVRPSKRLSVEPLVGVNARTPLVALSGAYGAFVLLVVRFHVPNASCCPQSTVPVASGNESCSQKYARDVPATRASVSVAATAAIVRIRITFFP
jgi:hypothetical protein